MRIDPARNARAKAGEQIPAVHVEVIFDDNNSEGWWTHGVEFLGPTTLIHSPRYPHPHSGATGWIETYAAIKLASAVPA